MATAYPVDPSRLVKLTVPLDGTEARSQRSPVWIEARTSRWRPDRDYPLAGGIGFGTSAGIEIPRIANAIGKAAAQRNAMNQNARGPNAP
jgi:hypothetical protein